MSNVLEYLRMALGKDNGTKIESYHLILDSALVLMNEVHKELKTSERTKQQQDAMILYQMTLAKGMEISHLIKGFTYTNNLTKATSSLLLDPTPIAVLTRSQMEAFSIFHNIFNSSSNQNVINILHDFWVVSGLQERQRIGYTGTDVKIQEKAAKEKTKIEHIILQIKSNPIYQAEQEHSQVKIDRWINDRRYEIAFRNNKLVLLTQKDLFINAGVRDAFSNQYGLLSWSVHPTNISVLQFSQMFEAKFNEENAFTFLYLSRIVISMITVEYCRYLSVAQTKFETLPKLNQMLIHSDNRVYRTGDFPSIFEGLEDEIQNFLKK